MNISNQILAIFLAAATLAVAAKADGNNKDGRSSRSNGLRGGFPKVSPSDEPRAGERNLRPGLSEDDFELFYHAGKISQSTYFIDKTNKDEFSCSVVADDVGHNLDFCENREDDIDAAAIVGYDGKCFVAFRGTRTLGGMSGTNINKFIRDSEQNVETSYSTLPDSGCKYRKGFADAYSSMKDFIDEELPKCKVATCGAGSSCTVVLTGHSQGGAAALVASFDQSRKALYDNPRVITFGAPPAAMTYSECASIINTNQHFRIVTSETNENSLSCDPITEHSKKRVELLIPGNRIVLEDKFDLKTVHLGNAIYLNKEKNGDYEIAQGSGDMTCQDFEPDEIQVLTNEDFVDGDSFFVKKNKGPLHFSGTYVSHLEDVFNKVKTNGETYGLTKNHVCTKNWQCNDGMLCGGSNTCFYRSAGYIDGDLTYKGGESWPIHLKYNRPENVQNLAIRIVRPSDDAVIECQNARNLYNRFDAGSKQGVGGYVYFQLGIGPCHNFQMLSNEIVDFNPGANGGSIYAQQSKPWGVCLGTNDWQCTGDKEYCSANLCVQRPTTSPTPSPTPSPSLSPTATQRPTTSPTATPSLSPTSNPTATPSLSPTAVPTTALPLYEYPYYGT